MVLSGNFARNILCNCSARVVENTGTLTLSGMFVENGGIAVVRNLAGAVSIHALFERNASLPIDNDATLTITNSRITTNDAAHGNPGAIFNEGGRLAVSNTTIEHNVGDLVGGIANINSASVTLTNDTIARNAARFDAASGTHGTLPSGAITNDSIAMIRNTTIDGNTIVGFHDWRYHAGGIVTQPDGYTALSTRSCPTTPRRHLCWPRIATERSIPSATTSSKT